MKRLNQLCKYFHSTDLYKCPKCKKELRNFQAELRAKVDAVPLKRKQEFINNLQKGNVGHPCHGKRVHEPTGWGRKYCTVTGKRLYF